MPCIFHYARSFGRNFRCYFAPQENIFKLIAIKARFNNQGNFNSY